MRTQRYLPRIQNGRVTKRQTRSKNPVTSKSFGAAKSSARRNSTRISSRAGKRNSEERGARVMWMMILIGIALTAGFVFALRSQISAYRLGQAEEQLRTKLDEYAGQQKFLMLDQQRALNTTESDRAGSSADSTNSNWIEWRRCGTLQFRKWFNRFQRRSNRLRSVSKIA